MMIRLSAPFAILILLIDLPAAQALSISGTVTDAAVPAQLLPGVAVEILDNNSPFGEKHVAWTFAAANGTYSYSGLSAGADPFVRVSWELSLGSAHGDHTIMLKDKGSGTSSGNWIPLITYTPKESATRWNITSNQTGLDVQMDQVMPAGWLNIQTRALQVLDFLSANMGTVPWSVNYNIPVHINTNNQSSFEQGGELYLAQEEFDGVGGPLGNNHNTLNFFHEMAHLVQYHIGNNATACGGSHTTTSENNPGCAFSEGWANYLAVAVGSPLGISSMYVYNPSKDSAATNWRGGGKIDGAATDAAGFIPTGYDPASLGYGTGKWESGEPVEGAVSGFLYCLQGVTSIPFGDILDVMITQQPSNVYEFTQGWVTKFHTSAPTKVQSLFTCLQKHGIVYSRALFKTSPFLASGPGGTAGGAASGNQIDKDGFVILRGVVTTAFEAASKARLGVDNTYSINSVRMIWKTATNTASGTSPPATDADEPASAFGNNGTAWATFATGSVQFATAPLTDGDYDLLMQAMNQEGFKDTFLPSWDGDKNPNFDKDEKYLKMLGAWYDKDRDYKTPTGSPWKQGMVIIDNTPPTVVTGSFFPP